jgi:SAM-dependent methyltransferase
MKRKLKNAYFQSKITSEAVSLARNELGAREIETLRTLLKLVKYEARDNLALLDLGCADRFIERSCLESGWSYTGLDYDQVDFEVDAFPLRAESVDIALSLALLEHLRDPENFFLEIFRCLKPGGLVYISTPNFQLDWKNFFNDPTHCRPYTPESLAKILELFGFTQVAVLPGLRCKAPFWYEGRFRFLRAFYMLPFRHDTTFPVPGFLKGHARSLFGIARKPL